MSPSKRKTLSPLKKQATVPYQSHSRQQPISPSKAQSMIHKFEAIESPSACDSPSPKKQTYIFKPAMHRRAGRRATLSPQKQVRIVEPTANESACRRTSLSPRKLDYSCIAGRSFKMKIPDLNLTKPHVAIQAGDEKNEETVIMPISMEQASHDSHLENANEGQALIKEAESTKSPDGGPQSEFDHEEILSVGEMQDLAVNAVDVGREDETDSEDSVIQYLLAEAEDEDEGSSNIMVAYTTSSDEVDIPDVNIYLEQPKDDMTGLGEDTGCVKTPKTAIEIEQAQRSHQMRDLAPNDSAQLLVTTTSRDENDDPGCEVIAQNTEALVDTESVTQKPSVENQSLNCTEEESPRAGPSSVDELATEEKAAHLTVTQSPRKGDATPKTTTRSLARLSDDTTMLKAFLDRAQAKKASKDVRAFPREPQPHPSLSPRRSPRKALAEKDGNSPSPQKPRDLTHRPGTPPSKKQVHHNVNDALLWEDIDEISASPIEHQRTRRSARSKKLPVPTKAIVATAGAPSFIPVRRADGTDPVVLQKGVAQELATLTRANTRRNKGQAKLPVFMLEEIQVQVIGEVDQERSVTRSQTKDTRKNVGWDEKLVYFQRHPEEVAIVQPIEEPEKPKVRRLRGLGGVNGTPAPKKRSTADFLAPPPANGTPAPKRRGRAR